MKSDDSTIASLQPAELLGEPVQQLAGPPVMSESQQVDGALAPIAKAVERFAAEHSLRLDKCARGNAGWELTGAHPFGGELFLLLLFHERLGLGVGSVWQYRCAEMATQYSHFRPVRPSAVAPDIVIAALNAELQALSQVPFGYWTHLQPLEPES